MIKSVENIIFNGVDLAEQFTDEEAGAYFIVNEVRGRGLQGEENTLVGVAGMDGAYLSQRRKPVRYLEVDITLKGESFEDLRRRIDRLSEILDTGKESVPITFDDESDRTYYGKLDTVVDRLEKSKIYQATLTFICPDPYKYGPEKVFETTSDEFIVENNGTAEAEPIIELTATQKATFAMVSNQDEEYILAGEPADTTKTVIDSRQLVFREDGSTLNNWANTPKILDTNFSVANGSLIGDPTGIYAEDYGSSNDKNHGGYKITELPKSLQDFRIETHFDVDTPTDAETFRIEVYAIAEDMSILGKIGMLDGNVNLKRRVGLARVGEYVGYGKNYTHYSGNYQHDRVGSSQTWYLRFIREGKQVRTRIARRLRGEQVRGKNGIFNIIDDDMLKRLRYIGVYIGFFGTTQRPRLARINHVDVYEIFKKEEDQTPYILYPGDVITFDHSTDDILLNGESRKDLKAFGGSFFTLKKGINTLTITPENTFNTKVTYRERYK